MVRRNNSTALKLESLEAREVPAVFLTGNFNGAMTTPDTGNIVIAEVSGTVTTRPNTGGVNAARTFTGTENDNLTFTLIGSTLTITNFDNSTNADSAILVRDQNGIFRRFGNTISIQGVTSLLVNMDQGGDDIITDNSALTATINAGPGNDTVNAAASGQFNFLIYQLLQNPNFVPDIAFLQALAANPGQKILNGGIGNDTLIAPAFGLLTQMDGGAGNDFIVGGTGVDLLVGGTGIDIMFGYGGKDFYVAMDGGIDLLGNQPGDTLFTFDPGVDILTTPTVL